MKRITFLMCGFLLPAFFVFGQPKDKAAFKSFQPGFYQNFIMKDIRNVRETQNPGRVDKKFFMDQSGMDLPNNPDLYHAEWFFPPLSQGNTGTCWCFSTTSMFESEVKRITGKEIKISEMFTVYWEYVEKARSYVQTRGSSLFDEGSEGNAVARIYKKYGAVPETVYNGLTGGRKFYDHGQMMEEMKGYLKSV